MLEAWLSLPSGATPGATMMLAFSVFAIACVIGLAVFRLGCEAVFGESGGSRIVECLRVVMVVLAVGLLSAT